MGIQRLRKDYDLYFHVITIGGDFFIYIKYKKDDVIKDIESKGFNVLEYLNNSNIIVTDSFGYRYKLNYTNILSGKKPSMLMRNPFAIDNLKQYLFNNHPYYELIDNEYAGCKKKMRFICHKHLDKGVQFNTPDNIINNHHVCRYCGYGKMGIGKRIDESTIINRCKELSLEYKGRTSKNGESYILFTCPKHVKRGVQGISWTHLKDCANGCSYCASSNGENRIRNVLTDLGFEFEEQKKFKECVDVRELRFDFYVEDIHTIIEYDGQQHFIPVNFSGRGMEYATKMLFNTQKRDRIKDNFCRSNNIRLIRISYIDYDNIEKILHKELMNENTNT